MKTQKLFLHSLIHSLGVLVYTGLVAWIMQNGESVFGQMNNYLGPVLFLMLFVLSATIVGLLVLLKPAMLYLDGKKKEGVQMLLYTIMWLVVLTIVVMSLVLVF